MSTPDLLEDNKFNAKSSFGSGFSVVLYTPSTHELSITHNKLTTTQKYETVDQVTKKLTPIHEPEIPGGDNNKMVMGLEVGFSILLIILISCLCCCLIRRKRNANPEQMKNLKGDNIEMIEQNFQTIRSDTAPEKEQKLEQD